MATCLLLIGVQAWTVAERNRVERSAAEIGAAVVLQVRGDSSGRCSMRWQRRPRGRYAMAAVQVTSPRSRGARSRPPPGRRDPPVGSARRGAVVGGRGHVHPICPRASTCGRVRHCRRRPARVRSPSPLSLSVRLDDAGTPACQLGQLRPGPHTYGATCRRTGAGCRLAALAVDHPGTDIGSATATAVGSLAPRRHRRRAVDLPVRLREPRGLAAGGAHDRRPGGPPGARRRAGVERRAPGGPYAQIVRGDSPEPLPRRDRLRAAAGRPRRAAAVGETTGLSGSACATGQVVDYLPRAGHEAVLVDLELALRLDDEAHGR